MALQISYEPLDSLRPYGKNPRTHSAAQIRTIEASLQRFGWCTPIGKADGTLIYGHARLQAAVNLRNRNVGVPGNPSIDTVPVVDLSYLSDEERRAYVIADNQLALQAGWDETLLGMEIRDLALANFDLPLLGFSESELKLLLNPPATSTPGDLLELINITVAEPVNVVAKGDHFVLGGRHHLVCVSVIEDWSVWTPLLTQGSLFVPYPGPFVPFGTKAADHTLILVQPDPYAAGHILDRYAEVRGAAAVSKMAP